MYIWISFLTLIFILLVVYGKAKTKRAKTVIEFILIIATVYFAAFRDGLGEDYTRYVYRTEILSNGEEMLNDLITNIIYLTPLSPIFYFFVTSLLIYPILLKLFLKERHFLFIIMSFFFSTGLGYYQSFNIIRQYVAVAFFFLASQYIVERRYLYYLGFVFIASLFHASALFLLPFVFFMDRKFNRNTLMLVIFISILGAPLIRPLGSLFLQNTQYSDYEQSTRGFSFLFLVLSMLMLLIVFSNKDHSPRTNILINGGVLCVSFFNLSVVSIAFSRFSIYFVPFLFVALFEIITITKRKITGVLIMSFFMFFFINFLLSSEMPEKILPVNSVFDSVYNILPITLH